MSSRCVYTIVRSCSTVRGCRVRQIQTCTLFNLQMYSGQGLRVHTLPALCTISSSPIWYVVRHFRIQLTEPGTQCRSWITPKDVSHSLTFVHPGHYDLCCIPQAACTSFVSISDEPLVWTSQCISIGVEWNSHLHLEQCEQNFAAKKLSHITSFLLEHDNENTSMVTTFEPSLGHDRSGKWSAGCCWLIA